MQDGFLVIGDNIWFNGNKIAQLNVMSHELREKVIHAAMRQDTIFQAAKAAHEQGYAKGRDDGYSEGFKDGETAKLWKRQGRKKK